MGTQASLFGNGGSSGKHYPQHEGCGGALLPIELTRQDTGTALVCARCHHGTNGSEQQRAQADRAARAEGFDLDGARRNRRLVLQAQAAPARKAVQTSLFGGGFDAPPAVKKPGGRRSPPGQGSLF